jgi:hypothetical protein
MFSEDTRTARVSAQQIPCDIDEQQEQKRQLACLCIELFLASRSVVADESQEWLN